MHTSGSCTPAKRQAEKWQNANASDASEAAEESAETVRGTRYLLKGYRFLGVHMPKNRKVLYLIWSFIVNMLLVVYLPLGFMVSLWHMSRGQVEVGHFLSTLQAAINIFACEIKIVIMYILLPKLLSCGVILRRLDKRCRSPEERRIIRDSVRKGNRTVILYIVCYWCYVTSSCFTALLFHRLPYNIYKPFIDIRASNTQFYFAVLVEIAYGNLACLQQVMDDSYPVIFVNIMRTHLRILLKRIENLNRNRHPTKSQQTNIDELKMCIIDHVNLIEVYDIVAPVISTTIFVQFTVTAVIMCITLINILIFAADFASGLVSCVYLFAVMMQILPLCYYAHCLMEESNRFPDILFHSNWVDQDACYRKLLIFFIQRSQRTIEFTAGKLFPITLQSFISIAKFSFSLYTFIEQMGLKGKFAD